MQYQAFIGGSGKIATVPECVSLCLMWPVCLPHIEKFFFSLYLASGHAVLRSSICHWTIELVLVIGHLLSRMTHKHNTNGVGTEGMLETLESALAFSEVFESVFMIHVLVPRPLVTSLFILGFVTFPVVSFLHLPRNIEASSLLDTVNETRQND